MIIKRTAWAVFLGFIIIAVMSINPLASGVRWTPTYTGVVFAIALAVAVGTPIAFLTKRYANQRWYAILYFTGLTAVAVFIVYQVITFKA